MIFFDRLLSDQQTKQCRQNKRPVGSHGTLWGNWRNFTTAGAAR